MKNLIKVLSVLSIFLICIFSVSFCGTSIVTSDDSFPNISDVTPQYSYGIFTEKYNIQYSKDLNGNIIMSKEDLTELNALSNDITSVKKILDDKKLAYKASGKTPSNTTALQTTSCLKKLDISNTGNDLVIINSTNSNNSVDNLTNFTSDITVTKAFPVEDGFGLIIRYRWWWDYDPVNTWADKVYIGWSDSFDTLGDETLSDGTLLQDKFNYYQTGYPLNTNTGEYDYNNPYKKTALALKGQEAITSISIETAVEKKFDIKCNFTYNGSQYRVVKHSGSMYINVGKGDITNFDKIFSFHGTYLHKVLNVGEASASFTPGENGGFTLGATAEFIYDKARDAYNDIKYSEILALM